MTDAPTDLPDEWMTPNWVHEQAMLQGMTNEEALIIWEVIHAIGVATDVSHMLRVSVVLSPKPWENPDYPNIKPEGLRKVLDTSVLMRPVVRESKHLFDDNAVIALCRRFLDGLAAAA